MVDLLYYEVSEYWSELSLAVSDLKFKVNRRAFVWSGASDELFHTLLQRLLSLASAGSIRSK